MRARSGERASRPFSVGENGQDARSPEARAGGDRPLRAGGAPGKSARFTCVLSAFDPMVGWPLAKKPLTAKALVAGESSFEAIQPQSGSVFTGSVRKNSVGFPHPKTEIHSVAVKAKPERCS